MAKKSKKSILIVESPGKIKKLKEILGEQFLVYASFGHIMELSKKRGNGLGVEVDNDFKAHYNFLPDKLHVVQALIDACSNAKDVWIASDSDREGECIAFHVRDAIISCGAPVYRVKFTEITKNAVLKAIENKGDFSEAQYNSQQSRRILDRLVGFLASPYIIKAFNDDKDMADIKLSAGRVQSVAIRLITDREKEIDIFNPEEYWHIFSTFAKPSMLKDKFTAKYVKKITDKTTANKIKNDLQSDQFIIKNIDAKEKLRKPFPPLTTSKLQQICASRYGLSVTTIMAAAQALYEGSRITYMRTDSVNCSPEAIDEVRGWLKDNNYNIPNKPNIYISKDASQNAHECCRPCVVSDHPDNIYLPDDQKKVYRVIWERFVSSQMLAAKYDTMSILVESSSGHELKASGRTLISPEWLSIATDQISIKSEDEDDISLPILKINDILVLVEPKVIANQLWTLPPSRFGEGSLVKELEKRGIGRPSTYGSIIEAIKSKGYVEIKNKVYHGTKVGTKVVERLKKYFKFLDYDYTSNMEGQLDLIAENKLSSLDMLNNFFDIFSKELQQAYLDIGGENARSDIICNKCNKNTTVIRHGKYGYYIQCLDLLCKGTQSVEIINDKAVLKQNKQIYPGASCPKCNGDMTKKQGKWGDFLSCLDISCGGTSKVPYGKKCPKCHNELFSTIYHDKPILFCMGYPSCTYSEDLKTDIPNPNNYSQIDDIPKKTKKILKSASKAKLK